MLKQTTLNGKVKVLDNTCVVVEADGLVRTVFEPFATATIDGKPLYLPKLAGHCGYFANNVFNHYKPTGL